MTATCLFVLAAAAAAAPAVEITVDPRIELLSVVQFLAGYGKTGLITRFDVAAKREVEERFGKFRDDPVVKLFQELWPRGFSYDGPPGAVFHLGGPPGFALAAEPDEALCGRAGGRKRLLQFFQGLRDFARASDFVKWFEGRRRGEAA